MARQPKDLPLTNAEIEAPITAKNFYRRGLHFIRITKPGMDLTTIRPGSEHWNLWREYFERHLQWVPQVMRRLIDRAANAPLWMTVPCDYPEQFDATFRHDPKWRPSVPPYTMSEREFHDTMQGLISRYGKTWGIKDMAAAIRRRPAYVSLTDDDLRKAYPPKQTAIMTEER